MNKRKLFSRVYIIAVLLLLYLPIAIVILYSFNVSEASSVWEGFTLSWYTEMFRDRALFEALLNSLLLATLSSVGAAIIATLAAAGMVRAKLRSMLAVEYLSTLPIMIPEIILGLVFLVFFSLIGLPFGMVTLVIAHTAFCIPYVYLMVKARLAGLDKSYVEAAKDLGAGDMRAFYDITLPLIMPAVVSGMMLSFAMSFDDVIISVFVTGVNTNTLPIKIYSQLKTGVTPKTNALCTMLFVVTVLLGLLSAWIARPRHAASSEKEQTKQKSEEPI